MNTDMDIVLCAIIAIVLFARLWTILGRRGSQDHERPNPFAGPPTLTQGQSRQGGRDQPLLLTNGQQSSTNPVRPPALAAPESIAGGIEQIRALDPGFDERGFLRHAREMFTSIVTAFVAGDMGTSAGQIAGPVLTHFEEAIAGRKARGEVLDNKISSITDAETAGVRVTDKMVSILVRIVSLQEIVLHDASGNIIGGKAGMLEEITDLWRFGRDYGQPGNGWQLIETRS